MLIPDVRPQPSQHRDHRVYADLDHLVRLQYQAKDVSFLPRQPITSILSGRHSSRLRGRGLNFEELRAYRPGDDIRTMDWKVTARTRRPHVRVFTEERDRPAILLIDQRRNMFFGSSHYTKSVTAAEAAALAAWRCLAVGDRVGAIVFNDTEVVEFKPQRSKQQVVRILKSVVDMNHQLHAGSSTTVATPDMFNQVLQRACQLASHDALVCTIGDTTGLDARSGELFTRINNHNDVLALFIYDALEQALPPRGPLVFSDGEGQVEFDTGNPRLRQQYADDFARRAANIEQVSQRQNIPVLYLHTAGDVAQQVRHALGSRHRARRN